MTQTTIKLSNYFKPTPKNMKKIGLAFMAIGTTISSSSIVGAMYSESKSILILALCSVILQALAQGWVEFFTREETPKKDGV